MNKPVRQRPVSIGPMRAFEAVARLLSFRAAGDELHLTQSAVSRQIRTLEADVGAALFSRGTRHVELTSEGTALLRSVSPWLERMDATVRQIRRARGRRVVSVDTFASFASLWLIPRLAGFQAEHPDIDIRVGASDHLVELAGSDIDVVLRYCRPEQAPPGAVRLFGEQVVPAASPWLVERSHQLGPPLETPADLARHTLLEEDNVLASTDFISWRRWLAVQGLPDLQPGRWLYFNYTHQQVQAALAGQGLTLTRIALTIEALHRGDLIEVLPGRRLSAPYAYWLITAPEPQAADTPPRPEVRRFCEWVLEQAALTRAAIGEAADDTGATAG